MILNDRSAQAFRDLDENSVIFHGFNERRALSTSGNVTSERLNEAAHRAGSLLCVILLKTDGKS